MVQLKLLHHTQSIEVPPTKIMRLFTRSQADIPSREVLAHQLRQAREKQRFYLLAILVLLQYLQKFSFDLNEIDAGAFKAQIDRLSQQFETEEKTKKIERQFEWSKEAIDAFIERERDYFLNKDREFKEVIQVLSSGIVSMNQENQRFNTRIHAQSLKIESLSQLDDIRKMKTALSETVRSLKQCVQKKQAQDARHIELLSSEVEILKKELEKTKNLSLTDGLTGAYNRLAFDTQLEKWVTANKQRRRIFSLMMIDIDNFKLINDAYGHPVGDRVIVALVQKCRQFIREDDFLARYGGEEFVIILPNTSHRQTMKRARSLCEAISEALYAVDDSGESEPLSFTVSVGVSTFRRGEEAASLLERADKALYAAKHAGKNRATSEKDLG